MNPTTFDSHGHSMRWYEGLTLLLLLGLAAGVRAESVYKCTGGDGGVAYQAQPCAAAQRETTVVIDPAPAYAPSPQYAVERRSTRASARRGNTTRSARREATSFECRASDGEIFYRHTGCPRSIAAASDRGNGGRGRGRSAKTSVSVSARAIPRDQACAQLRRAGSIGRAGHEHDEIVSTYERDLGHDPCN